MPGEPDIPFPVYVSFNIEGSPAVIGTAATSTRLR